MHRRLPKRSKPATVYLVLNDFRTGLAYVETAASEADRETIVQNFLSGRYSNALSVGAFNAAEGLSWDVSEDIALDILQRAVDDEKTLGEATLRFVDRHVVDLANPAPRAPISPIDPVDVKPDFQKRPAAPSLRSVPEGNARHRARKNSE
jgi:hypothetical protein